MDQQNLQQLCIDTLRTLAIDAVDNANSGHPGLPLGAAPMAHVIWDRFLRHSPQNPNWFNRDRFILSAGHGCALLYSLLHVHGYDLSLQELKNFRQWQSQTPGHPEYGHTAGVEATTGPLGQGFAMGVGMAIAEKYLAHYFNRPDFAVVDHNTYAIVSDGDLMEGVASEAASLAGHLGLGKLIYLYDDNSITIEGPTSLTFTENVHQRFESYLWHVQEVEDGNDTEAISQAVENAQAETTRPSLIIIKTHIGFASPKQDTADAHGSPLGAEGNRQTKANLNWPYEESFCVPYEVKNYFEEAKVARETEELDWYSLLREYSRAYPKLAEQLEKAMHGERIFDWALAKMKFTPEEGPVATRAASGKVLNSIAQQTPFLLGGSADLGPSNKTTLNNEHSFSKEQPGRNLHFGIREHAMGAVINGMVLHGGLMVYGGTFLAFSDYMRPAIRLSALMNIPSIFVFTHDSICLGEDGPTHQAVEHLMSLRLIPHLTLIRPADANETAQAWKLAVSSSGPVALALTRQKLPILDSDKYPIEEGVAKGAYVISAAKGQAQAVIIATGSEVHLALEVQELLAQQNIFIQVVSAPSLEIFARQTQEHQQQVLPDDLPKVAIEAGATLGWERWVGSNGKIIGLDRFGASAPWKVAYEKLGFSPENVIREIKDLLQITN